MTASRLRRSSRLAAVAAVAAVVVFAPVARAADPTLAQCLSANEQAIKSRADHKLRASRDQSLTCAATTCPRAVRDVCQKRVTELTSAIPSIVFEVKDGAGHDLSAVVVKMDGQPLVDRVDGSPIPVDPGEHTFSFEAAGQAPVEKRMVVYEAVKDRHEPISIGPAPTVSFSGNGTGAPPPAEPPAPQPSTGLGTQRILGLSLGGAGIAGLAVGTVFGFMTMSRWSSVKDACGSGGASHCAASNPSSVTSDKNAAQTDGTISTVAFIAGGLLVAAGATLFFTGGHAEAGVTASTGVSLAPAVGPGTAGLSLGGAF